MTEFCQFSSIASLGKIDSAAGIISGVSIITLGEAQGRHSGTWIDKTTLSQIHKVACQYPDGIKVKLSQSKEHDGSAGQIVGVLKNFYTEGNQEKANLYLLKASDKFSLILEMSATMPSEFGFSVVMPKEIERVDDRDCLRCSEIYSIDLVEAPAANPSGLFTSKPTETTMSIKYAKGDSGDHAADCDCKACESAKNKKEMSAMIAEQIALAIKGIATPDITGLTAKIEEAATKLSKLELASAESLKLSKKGEIDNLVAEASRDGKVIPLTDVQLSKMEVADIKEMITKLPKSTIRMSKQPTAPKTADGKDITNRRSPEFMAFASEQRRQGAIELGGIILSQQTGLTRN